jgi:hypothetical protein
VLRIFDRYMIVMVFNVTIFNNISAISWLSVLLVEETGRPMVQKSFRKLVVRGILDTANTHSLDHSFSRVGTDTPIKCDGVKLV